MVTLELLTVIVTVALVVCLTPLQQFILVAKWALTLSVLLMVYLFLRGMEMVMEQILFFMLGK